MDLSEVRHWPDEALDFIAQRNDCIRGLEAENERLRAVLRDTWWASCGCLGGMLDEFSDLDDVEPQ